MRINDETLFHSFSCVEGGSFILFRVQFLNIFFAVVAQLVERHIGNVEVASSILVVGSELEQIF